jgi:hypothetical protein
MMSFCIRYRHLSQLFFKSIYLTLWATAFLLPGLLWAQIAPSSPSTVTPFTLPRPIGPPLIPINVDPGAPQQTLPPNNMPSVIGLTAADQMGIASSKRAREIAEMENDAREMANSKAVLAWKMATQYYREALGQLLRMNPDSFSLTKAEFLVENAYMDNTQSFEEFNKALLQRAELVKQILKREGLSRKNDLAVNYGIQQLFCKQNLYKNPETKQSVLIAPVHYDFDDFMGEKDYTKLFVCKVLARGSGQCHSMPLLYLMLAEQLGAKAWLSLAPQHSYIQFCGSQGKMFSFETTNGNLVSSTWMMESGFITTEALRHDLYLDTLSKRQLYAQVLADLLLGYTKKFGYDQLADELKSLILRINPENMTALIVDANAKTSAFLHMANEAGRPKREDLPKHPELMRAWEAMNAAYGLIDNLGYQDMPKDAYKDWLKSIEEEKKKDSQKSLQEHMHQEIQHLKNMKASVKPQGIQNR